MALGVAAALQIFDDVLDAPGPQPAALRAIKPRRKPAVDQAAAISLPALVGAEHVLWGMACAAMRGAFDQIGAAIPFLALLGIFLERAGLEEQPIPAAHHHAIVQRKA